MSLGKNSVEFQFFFRCAILRWLDKTNTFLPNGDLLVMKIMLERIHKSPSITNPNYSLNCLGDLAVMNFKAEVLPNGD